jgi:hypothetical protein
VVGHRVARRQGGQLYPPAGKEGVAPMKRTSGRSRTDVANAALISRLVLALRTLLPAHLAPWSRYSRQRRGWARRASDRATSNIRPRSTSARAPGLRGAALAARYIIPASMNSVRRRPPAPYRKNPKIGGSGLELALSRAATSSSNTAGRKISTIDCRRWAPDLVRRQVAVIATLGGNAASLAAKPVTTTTPVVCYGSADPVE